jgi:hypothetical protein
MGTSTVLETPPVLVAEQVRTVPGVSFTSVVELHPGDQA